MSPLDKPVSNLQKIVQMEEVPRAKFGVMVGRTIIGALLIAYGIAGMALYEMNQYMAAGFVLLGATVWSSSLVTNSLKALIAPLKAIRRAATDTDEPDGG